MSKAKTYVISEVRPVVCQMCKFHLSKPSRCRIYRNKFVGRKQAVCKRFKIK